MKKLFTGLLIVAGLFVVLYFYYFHLTPIKKGDPLYAVPANAALIIQLDDPYQQWNKLTSNKIWNYLKTNSHLAELGTQIDSLNNEVQKNESLWSFAAARPLVLSMHRIRNDEYNYLYVVDLQRSTQLNFIKNYTDRFVDDGTKVLTRDYHGSEIIELAFDDSPTRLYLTINDNLLSVSTTHTLIEKSIDQLDKSQVARDLDFVDINKYMDSNKATLYLQHKYFTEFLSKWLNNVESVGLSFFESTKFTGINLEMADDYLALHGYSNVI